MVEQSNARAEQDGHQVDMDFLKQSGFEALLHNRRGGYHNMFFACNRFCLFNGAFHAVGDEGDRPSFLDPFWRSMALVRPGDVCPPYPPVRSNNLRPATSAPICLFAP